MKNIIIFFALCLAAWGFDFSKLRISESEFHSFLDLAKKKHLSEQKYWKQLLHFNYSRSEISNKFGFFYAKDGHLDAQSELENDIFQFFIDKKIYENRFILLNQADSSITFSNDADNLHFVCRFPLRARFIAENLGVDLPKLACTDYQKFISYIEPKSISIVFPAAYLNSPASMFGHSFLLINSKYNSRLLSYAFNFAANADQSKENPLVFTAKGLFGGYDGRYSLKPYYDVLKTYEDSENRDLYEYDFDFSEAEIKRILQHIWEIKDSASSYYFFSNNCSYNLLWLLEIARPTLSLRHEFSFVVVPSKTLQIMQKNALFKDYHYRASKLSKIKTMSKNMSYLQKNTAKNIALESGQIKGDYATLALANELSMFYAIKQKISLDEYKQKTHAIASQLSKEEPMNLPEQKAKTSVILGNFPSKISFYGGNLRGILLDFRATYHSVYENDFAFESGVGVVGLAARWQINDEIKLKKATLLDIKSLNKLSFFTPSPSYSLDISYDEIFGAKSVQASAAAGLSVGDENWLFSALFGANLSRYKLKAAADVFAFYNYQKHKISLEYQAIFDAKVAENKISLKIHSQIAKNLAFFSEVNRVFFDSAKNEFLAGFDIYF